MFYVVGRRREKPLVDGSEPSLKLLRAQARVNPPDRNYGNVYVRKGVRWRGIPRPRSQATRRPSTSNAKSRGRLSTRNLRIFPSANSRAVKPRSRNRPTFN